MFVQLCVVLLVSVLVDIGISTNAILPVPPSPGASSSGGSRSTSGSAGLSSASSGLNMGGCRKLADNCNFDCLSLDSTGCITCTCAGNTGNSLSGSNPVASSSGGGITSPGTGSAVGASALQNNNGCPPFPANCAGSCAMLDSNGCPICTCGSSNSSSLMASASTSSNRNGCPPFVAGCVSRCLGLDGNGCPVCTCPGGDSHASSTGTAHQLTSGSTSNANGCPAFIASCRQDCVTLDGHGCPVCICDNTATGSSTGSGSNVDLTHASSSQTTSHAAGQNNNGCPPFPTNCRSDCVSLNSVGCPLCKCSHTSSGQVPGSVSGTGTSHNQYNQLNLGSAAVGNGCPVFRNDCSARCTTINDNGCPICSCPATGPTTSPSSHSPSSSLTGVTNDTHTVECPPLIAHCNTKCLATDNFGCILCDGDCHEKNTGGSPAPSVSLTTTTTTAAPTTSTSGGNPSGSGTAGTGIGGSCPPFNVSSCSVRCSSFDVNGCLVCTCKDGLTQGNSSQAHSGSNNLNNCQPFDTSCPAGCAAVDSNGCLSCMCAVPNNSSTSTGSSGGTTGVVTCAAFDGTTCDPSCMHLDARGCLSCRCTGKATTPSPINQSHTTSAGTGSGKLTTFAPIMPSKNATGTSNGGVGTGSGNNNNCPQFNAACPARSTRLDQNGCLTCTSVAPINNSTGSGSSKGGSNCPTFDVTCLASCISINAVGCMTCTCHGHNSTASGSGRNPGTGNGCPPFDTSCPPGCAKMDAMGCVSCTCKGSTISPEVTTHTGSGSSGNANGCPAVDIMACMPTCLKLDQNGCIICECAATVPAKTMTTAAPSSSTVPRTTSASPTTTSGVHVTTPAVNTATSGVPITTSGVPVTTASVPTNNPGPVFFRCPKFDNSCPARCITINNRGCLECSCLATPAPATSQPPTPTTAATPVPTTPVKPAPPTAASITQPITTVPGTMTPPTTPPTPTSTHVQTTPAVKTCPFVRCLYPCDGVILGADNCPVCKCKSLTTDATTTV